MLRFNHLLTILLLVALILSACPMLQVAAPGAAGVSSPAVKGQPH